MALTVAATAAVTAAETAIVVGAATAGTAARAGPERSRAARSSSRFRIGLDRRAEARATPAPLKQINSPATGESSHGQSVDQRGLEKPGRSPAGAVRAGRRRRRSRLTAKGLEPDRRRPRHALPRLRQPLDPEQEATQRLRAQYAEISQLAGGLAHEIRNPLSTLSLNLDLLLEDFQNAGDPA